ncbi:hypothetical protein AB836_01460 [Rickettsiales bacterium (ex Bugula neritina AB1)]|nr:hypothetical protein AB836_01460 [Rickettsiales bacterium (ex Bugula neritina AB1)]
MSFIIFYFNIYIMYNNIFLSKDYDNFQKYKKESNIYLEEFSSLENLLKENDPLIFYLVYPKKQIIYFVSKNIYSHHKFFILCKNTWFLKGYVNKNNNYNYDKYIENIEKNNIKDIPAPLLLKSIRGLIIKMLINLSKKSEKKLLMKKVFNLFFITKNIPMSINLIKIIKNSL